MLTAYPLLPNPFLNTQLCEWCTLPAIYTALWMMHSACYIHKQKLLLMRELDRQILPFIKNCSGVSQEYFPGWRSLPLTWWFIQANSRLLDFSVHRWLSHQTPVREELHCQARCYYHPWAQCSLYALNLQFDNGGGCNHPCLPLACLQRWQVDHPCHHLPDSMSLLKTN